jgi:LmbE family N-acetylglucosaminyl deacetylase
MRRLAGEAVVTSEIVLAALLAGRSIPGRHLLITAHPDDETISAFAVRDQAETVTIVQLTDGVHTDTPHREDKVAVRMQERAAAVSGDVVDLGLPGRDAHLFLAVIIERLRPLLTAVDAVWTHPYEGGHLDHDTAAWLAQTLCPASVLRMEFASYYMRSARESVFGDFAQREPSAVTVVLAGDRGARKQQALDAYPSQAHILRKFRDPMVERYRQAPTYDFRHQPPAPLCRWDARGYQPSTAMWRQAIARQAVAA